MQLTRRRARIRRREIRSGNVPAINRSIATLGRAELCIRARFAIVPAPLREGSMKRLALFIATGALAVSACADPIAPPPDQTGSGGDDSQVQLPATAVAQIEALIAEKAARTPAQRKISSQLLYAASGRVASATADTKDPTRRITSLAPLDGKGRALVDIKGDAAILPD